MLSSYDAASVTELPKDHLNWLRNLPTHFDDGLRFFVHAGIRPGVPLDRQTRDDMLWIREPFLSWTGDFGKLIVHGHSPTESRRPDVRFNRINVDTGCVFFDGTLTAAVFTDAMAKAIDFIDSR